jgi:hypothetical protein
MPGPRPLSTAGLDWKGLYEEAVRVQLSGQHKPLSFLRRSKRARSKSPRWATFRLGRSKVNHIYVRWDTGTKFFADQLIIVPPLWLAVARSAGVEKGIVVGPDQARRLVWRQGPEHGPPGRGDRSCARRSSTLLAHRNFPNLLRSHRPRCVGPMRVRSECHRRCASRPSIGFDPTGPTTMELCEIPAVDPAAGRCSTGPNILIRKTIITP